MVMRMKCVGKKGCGYMGNYSEFRTGKASPPLKCPKCGKANTFKSWSKGREPFIIFEGKLL